MLGIAKELILQRHEVVVYNTEEYKTAITGVGARFKSITHKDTSFFRDNIGAHALTMAGFLVDAADLLIKPLLSSIAREQPDCIVHDSLNVWGKLVATKLNIPTICVTTTFVLAPRVLFASGKYLSDEAVHLLTHIPQGITLYRKYHALYDSLRLPSPAIHDIFMNKEKLNIVLTSRFFQPFGDSLGKDYAFVGPIIYQRTDAPDTPLATNTTQPTIYVSLGTIYNNQPAFYRAWISFFKHSTYKGYISIGAHVNKKDLGPIPKNVTVGSYLPQLELLKKVTLFVSHGGMSSVNESLYFGVPMLLFPQIQEQKINAARVEALGAGIWLRSKSLHQAYMKQLVETIIANNSYRTHAKAIGKTMHEAGGALQAVAAMQEYLKSQ